MLQASPTAESRYWKLSFIIISALLLIVMPLISRCYGQSGDEWLQIEYGQDIWNYFFHNNLQALDYNPKGLQYVGLEYYGGFFDFFTEILHRWFPSIPHLLLRHFFNALFGAGMMIFTGLFVRRLSGRWDLALMALLFIVFSPRIFGESMNNPKDIPFGCGYIMGMYCWLAFMQDLPRIAWKHAIGVALGFGIAFGVRSAGGLLQVVHFGLLTLLYYFTNKEFKSIVMFDNKKLLKRGIIILAGALIVGYIIAMAAWPWGLQSPLSRPLESLKEMTNRNVTINVFFEGVFRPNSNQPWYYELKWIVMSNPIIVIIGAGLFLLFWAKVRKQYGTYVAVFLVFAAFFTPLYMIYKKSSVHDTWRHVFFIYPFWVSMAAFGISMIGDFIKHKHAQLVPFVVAVLGLTPAIAWTVKEHPNQYVYFNEFVGGIAGANGYYDTDYYQNSALQASDWIIKNAKKVPGRKITVASNMLGFDKYFAKDTSWITWYYVRFPERHQKEWDYYVTYSRFIPAEQLQNDKWPPANAVHRVEAGGVTIGAVLQRKSHVGIDAYAALQKQDFATAAQLYTEYLKEDPSDENAWANYGIAVASMGQIDAGINAINKAIDLDGRAIQLYEILEKLYQAKGDAQGAQQATNRKNAAIMQAQELSGQYE